MLLRCRDLWDRCYVTCCYAADGVGWGGGWDVNVPCTSYITFCYAVEISGIVATSHVVTLLMVWGGVGSGDAMWPIKRFEITYTVLCGDAMWPRMRD